MTSVIEQQPLCEQCSRSLSLDDLRIGGTETSDKDGKPRLVFQDTKIEYIPEDYNNRKESLGYLPYKLIAIEWDLEDTLPEMPNLSESSNLGCSFCRAVHQELKECLQADSRRYNIEDGPMALNGYLSLTDNGIEGIVIKAHLINTESYRDIAMLFPIEASDSCKNWLGTESAHESTYLTTESIKEMRNVLEMCSQTCHPPGLSKFLPTRLIDVGDDSSSVARLVMSSGILQSESVRYAALSYCWGKPEDAKTQAKTEKASIKARCEGISEGIMTPAISDAIALTRAVNLRYVWIDALCIIQDDKMDWARESSQMNLVYRHAFVTFCGLNSNSCRKTLLQRGPCVKIPFQSSLRQEMKGYYLIRLQAHTGNFTSRTREGFDRSCDWNKRAWTLQEGQLSTRLLMFGALNMRFACGRSTWSEGDTKLSPVSDWEVNILGKLARIESGEVAKGSIYDDWFMLIGDYFDRSLSFQKDRFPAVSGLARVVSEALQDEYLAGLWKGDILRGLCWTSEPTCQGLHAYLSMVREREYIAPSWSWASHLDIHSLGLIPNAFLNSIAKIVDYKITTEPENPFGQVSDGFLRLRGAVAPVPVPLLLRGNPDEWADLWWYSVIGEIHNIRVSLDWLSWRHESGLQDLVMIRLLLVDPPEQEYPFVPELYILVLHPTRGPNQFLRVGLMKSRGKNSCDTVNAWFENSVEKSIYIV